MRVDKIAEGFGKMITNQKTEVSENRASVCGGCEFNNGLSCNVCGCVISAKTKVLTEVCPKNKWEDIKTIPDTGIAIRLHETDKAFLKVLEGVLTIEHKNPYKHMESPLNTLITLDLINLRADEKRVAKENIKLTNIRTNHCGCYTSTINNKETHEREGAYKSLDDGDHVKLTLMYNTELNPKYSSMTKSIKILTDQGTFIIKSIGEVNE